ncbi:MAG: hypothetical protein ABSA76_12560 [Bacteroidales bacterium]
MDNSIILVLVGGLISLISVLAGALLQYFIEKRKSILQLRSHPSTVVYNKQVEFLEKLNPVLNDLNNFITTLDVWLGEKQSEKVLKYIENARQNTNSIDNLDRLIDQFFIFLPSEILKELSELSANCRYLIESPNTETTYKSIKHLLRFQNRLRHYVGTEELSEDLLKSFSKTQQKVKKQNS